MKNNKTISTTLLLLATKLAMQGGVKAQTTSNKIKIQKEVKEDFLKRFKPRF